MQLLSTGSGIRFVVNATFEDFKLAFRAFEGFTERPRNSSF